MKNRKKLYIVLAIIAVGVLCAIFYPKQDNQSYSEQEATKMASFIDRFNQSNPSDPIDDGIVRNYEHHGSVHDDQIIFNKNDFEIVVTNTHDNRFKTNIKGERQKTNDDYKEAFVEFAKVYSPALSEQIINDYWTRLMDDNTHSVTFDEFDCYLSGYDNIEMITIDGDIQ